VGNRLHAVVCDRGGASASTLSGSGWTLHEQEVVAQSSGSFRFYMAVWEKVAGASEPTTVTATLTGGGDCGILLCQWESDSGQTFTYDTSTSANTSNAGTITSQATGTTGSTSGTQACFSLLPRLDSIHRRACHGRLSETDQRRSSVAARRPFCPCGQATTEIAVTVETAVLVPHGHGRR
jgi:hypothetical protein